MELSSIENEGLLHFQWSRHLSMELSGEKMQELQNFNEILEML